jgi:GNAT superfamily N-acetyltransferase
VSCVRELDLLREIERDAGQAFAEIGMDEIANDEPLSVRKLGLFLTAGRAWVAVDDQDSPVAYLLSRVVDGAAHIEQVSVARVAASHRVGAMLIDHLSRTAADGEPMAVTLTTFRDVPWNAPYYERLGFVVVPAADQGPQLAALVAREALAIPGNFPRVAMRRWMTR